MKRQGLAGVGREASAQGTIMGRARAFQPGLNEVWGKDGGRAGGLDEELCKSREGPLQKLKFKWRHKPKRKPGKDECCGQQYSQVQKSRGLPGTGPCGQITERS